ncbi:hypothetical protein CSC94_23025 [Zhengella mangrovi]|uniref:DUF736 domain-containing protein n=1 Tax=Zhengella mangrovi TaxID=1982044 RepID=A0A2G1QGR4_9HYPH|nr:hypothetical protein [Zhengella mangrovi]PHP64703.1 hypothetical protein CSC94_23025 [Zhengella mangrovi]
MKPNGKQPTHSAYAVEGEGEKTNWTEIGALWPHDDGKGFSLMLRALPVNGRMVIRERKQREQADLER